MLVALTISACLATASPPEATDANTKDVVQSWVGHAHRALAKDVSSQLSPNLRSYEAIARSLSEQLVAVDSAQSAIKTLDALRRSGFAEGLENTIPGFPWLLKTFDRVRSLSERLQQVLARMTALEKTAAGMLLSARRYADAPTDAHFQSLMRGFEDAAPIFADGRTAFMDIHAFAADLQRSLASAGETVASIQKLPLIGDYAIPLATEIQGLSGKLQLVQGVAKIAIAAIERDREALQGLTNTMLEARAHDAYADATRAIEEGHPGSGLNALRELRTRWPDTPWAHRADRRIVTLVARLDALQSELDSARFETADLRARVQAEQRTAAAEAQRGASLAATASAAAAHQHSPLAPWQWWAGGVLLLLSASGLAYQAGLKRAEAPE